MNGIAWAFKLLLQIQMALDIFDKILVLEHVTVGVSCSSKVVEIIPKYINLDDIFNSR